MPCPCFSLQTSFTDIVSLSEWHSPGPQHHHRHKQALQETPVLWFVPLNSIPEQNSFLLSPFASPYLLSKPLHYSDAVTFQGPQWACLCSSVFFSNPGGSLDGAESPRKIIGVQISNEVSCVGSAAFHLFLILQVKWNTGMKKREMRGCNVCNNSAKLKASNKLSQRDTGDVKMQGNYNTSKDCWFFYILKDTKCDIS